MIFFFSLQLQAKATILTTERKKVLYCSSDFPHYIYARCQSFSNAELCFFREEKLYQKNWLELRISASTSKWPHTLQVLLSYRYSLFQKQGWNSCSLLNVSCVDKSSHCCLQGLHSASVPGILALDLCPSDTSKVLTGNMVFSQLLHCDLRFIFFLFIGQ